MFCYHWHHSSIPRFSCDTQEGTCHDGGNTLGYFDTTCFVVPNRPRYQTGTQHALLPTV